MAQRKANVAIASMVAALLWGCGEDGGMDASSPAFQPAGDIHDTMTLVLDPAADTIWGSAGFVITAAGEQSLAPVDDDGWSRVKHSAAVLAESGNLMLMPHLLPTHTDALQPWQEYAHGMTRIAQQALQAANDQDAEALFEIGGHLYNVCLACHQAYARDEDA